VGNFGASVTATGATVAATGAWVAVGVAQLSSKGARLLAARPAPASFRKLLREMDRFDLELITSSLRNL
jgi:hypothetical protein